MREPEKTKEQLIRELRRLRRKVAELEVSEATFRRMERDLAERVKELRCIHDIVSIVGAPYTTIDKQFEDIVNALPRAWHYPEIACARITVNDREYKTSDYRDTEWKMHADILIHGARAGAVEVGYLEARPEMSEGPFSEEERLLIDTAAERLGIVAERKQSEELFRTVSDSSPLGIYILRDERLQYINPQFQRLTGYSCQELLGRNFMKLVSAEDSDVVRSSTVLTLRENRPFPCEYRIISRNKEVKWVMQTVSATEYDGKEVILGNLMDITERKYLERKMNEYEELSKMKSDLLATVSHELRTPLASIKGYATMMIDYFTRLNHEEKKDYLKSIDNSTDRLAKLVDNLLDTSRMEAGLLRLHKASTSISKLLRETTDEALVRANQHHTTLIMEKDLPRVNIDAKRIRQVLDNLLDNAVKYSSAGTEVLVSARRDGEEVVISISDQGLGIPPEEQTRVFDRMYRIEQRLDPGISGIGLGLSICQRLVKDHGGRIWIESEIGRGSTFHFTLPVATADERVVSIR
jgi:PAS domain S-box-containing protein